MGKMYGKLFLIFLLSLISMSFYVSALPNGAATCDIDSQDIEGGHGPSNLQGPAGYKITTNMKAKGTFDLTLSGPGKGFQGLLVYVTDQSGKKLGEFTNLPSTMQIKQCEGQPNSVTHKNSNVKPFPFTLSWNAPQGTTGNLTVRALVVRDQTDYARLDKVQIDPASGASSAPTPANANTNPNTSTVQTETDDGFLQKYSLFLIMAGITTLLYVVGSVTEAMLKRQQVKSRSFAKTINGFENSR